MNICRYLLFGFCHQTAVRSLGCGLASRAALAATAVLLSSLGAFSVRAAGAYSVTLGNSSVITLTNGMVDLVVYPTDSSGSSTLSSGGSMFPDSLSLSPVPVVIGFKASEDFIDLRNTLMSASTAVWDSNYADSQSAPVFGTDPTYTAYRTYGSLLNQPYSISGNTLSAGGGTTGILVGYTDDSSWMPVYVFFESVVGTITASNFLFPGDASPGAADTTSPSVTSVTAPASGNYRTGTALSFTVNYDEAVLVSTNSGVPRIALTLDTGGTVYANYASGSNSTALVFSYTVGSGTLDTNGLTLGSTIQLNGGSMSDAATNAANLTLTNVGSLAAVKVDGIAPTVTSITRLTPSSQMVKTNGVVYQVAFSEAVTNVASGRFSITPIGASSITGSVGAISGGPQTYTVTVNVTGGAGEFRLTAP